MLKKMIKSFAWLPLVSVVSYSGATFGIEKTQQEVFAVMDNVATWQWSLFDPKTSEFKGYDKLSKMAPKYAGSHPQGWVYASFYAGMTRWAELAQQHGDKDLYPQLKRIAEQNRYTLAPRIYNADDYAIGQFYLDLYKKYQDPKMIQPLISVFDIILNSPPTNSLIFDPITMKSEISGETLPIWYGPRRFVDVPCKHRWCWADALFMGPPVWFGLSEVTGDKRYAEFADKEFWATVDLLWDDEDQLFFRDSRFFDKREKNGEKVIWARGVGWVAAGLARILEVLPADHAKRAQYEDIFRKMMTRLAGAQQEDGFWRPSVLAPESQPYKESSGTALIAYAYIAGINQGVLDKKQFLPVFTNAWQALEGVIQPDGKMGWVQQIAAKPFAVSKDDTQLYAVGALLLAGTEYYKYLGTPATKQQAKK